MAHAPARAAFAVQLFDAHCHLQDPRVEKKMRWGGPRPEALPHQPVIQPLIRLIKGESPADGEEALTPANFLPPRRAHRALPRTHLQRRPLRGQRHFPRSALPLLRPISRATSPR